jgi:pimeloyl-ACP methyl ester carboxylesterase
MLDGFVRRGYAVAATDYEGNGTPGSHPYLVATSSARDVAGIVIASRTIDPAIGHEWIVMGHSEGGAAALATAALGQQLAPDLRLVGAVAYAPLSYPQGLLRGELVNTTPNEGLAILGLMIEGFASADTRIVLSKLLDAEALPLLSELQERCIPDIIHASQWSRIVPRSIFRPQGEEVLQAFDDDLVANDPEFFAIAVPTLLVQGLADALIASQSTVALRDSLHRNGTLVAFKTYFGATHGSVLAASMNDVAAWTAQRFDEAAAGAPASIF